MTCDNENTYTLDIVQGESFAFAGQIVDDNGQPYDLSDYTVTAQMRVGKSDPYPAASFTVTTGTDGQLTLELSAATTLALNNACYWYDVRLVNNTTGKTEYFLTNSKALVTKSVTK